MELVGEVKKLKYKCNQQLNRIKTLEQELERFNSDFFIFLDGLGQILKEIQKNNEIIPYKNYSKNSNKYYKVEKIIFEDYIENAGFDKKIFIDMCISFSFIKSDEKRYIWSDIQGDQTIRVYMINKLLFKLI